MIKIANYDYCGSNSDMSKEVTDLFSAEIEALKQLGFYLCHDATNSEPVLVLPCMLYDFEENDEDNMQLEIGFPCTLQGDTRETWVLNLWSELDDYISTKEFPTFPELLRYLNEQ